MKDEDEVVQVAKRFIREYHQDLLGLMKENKRLRMLLKEHGIYDHAAFKRKSAKHLPIIIEDKKA